MFAPKVFRESLLGMASDVGPVRSDHVIASRFRNLDYSNFVWYICPGGGGKPPCKVVTQRAVCLSEPSGSNRQSARMEMPSDSSPFEPGPASWRTMDKVQKEELYQELKRGVRVAGGDDSFRG